LQHRLKAKPGHPQIQVIKEYGDLPAVECYAGQINQVFMNLLSNAIDALEEALSTKQEEYNTISSLNAQGSALTHQTAVSSDAECSKLTIRISTEVKEDNTVLIRIADNGPGIPSQMQQQIFDPFFTTKPVGKGTGLGLSISYQIVVEKHGGQLKCFSMPGEGTEFWIELPMQLSHQEAT
jgi:signal transduction histidine kinase